MDDQPVWIYAVNVPGQGIQDLVSLVQPDIGFEGGLPSEAIVGRLLKPIDQGGTVTPENFVRNKAFVDFMHEVIGRCAPELPRMKAEAEQIGAGYVYLIDARRPTPEGEVSPDDIIGAFEVQAGAVVAGSYQPNPNHVILSPQGFFRLEPALQNRLLAEISSRISKQA